MIHAARNLIDICQPIISQKMQQSNMVNEVVDSSLRKRADTATLPVL